MKKLILLVGVALGFILGSRMGREPYERMESKVRELARRPEVNHAAESVSNEPADFDDTAATAASHRISGITSASNMAPGGGPTTTDFGEVKNEAAIDGDLARTFPSSDPPSNWAGPDRAPIAEDEVERNGRGEVEGIPL
jgi:hypothetical protein